MGDIVRYELIASEALVRLAARDRLSFIDRFVGLGRRAVEAGTAGDPFAYVLPPPPMQRDPEAWTTLANVLIVGGVEVRRAAEPLTADGRSYPAGSLVVLMGQPFRAHAKDLLEIQRYTPVADRPPYDVAGWTLAIRRSSLAGNRWGKAKRWTWNWSEARAKALERRLC